MSKKILSMLLVLSMIFTMLPASAMAEEADFTVGSMEELIELASLDEAEKTVTTGTSLEDLELSETSTVTVGTNPYTVNGIINGSEEETTVDIPAIWTSEPEFDMDTELPVLTMEEKVDSTVGAKGEIISFEPLDEKEKTVTVGTSLEDLGLPEILTAKVRTNPDTVTGIVYGSEEETTVDVPVTWISEPEYDMDNKGEYVFTPVIEGYIVSAELPMITVTVKAQVKPMMMLSMGEPIEVSTFAALKNAIDNATEDLNLKLTADIIYTGSAALTIPDTKDIDITIDLNDKIFSSSKVSAIEHNGKGTLTIEDNGEEGIGMIKTIDYVTSTINVKNKEAKLRINSGTVENQCTYYTDTRVIHHTAGTIYINGGTINCVNGYGIYSYADYDNNGIINIYDGTIKGANHGIYVLSSVVVNIDGGIIEGTNDTSNAIHLTVYSYGKVTITDGTVHTTGTEAAIHHRGNVTLDILGGTIENTGSGSAIFSNYTGSSSTAVPLTIGGEAELKSNNPDSNSGTIHASTNKVSLMITGGTVVNTSETGNAIFCANPLQANIRSGNSLIKGGNLAIKGLAPIVRVNMKGIASLDYNGEVTEDYQADNINSYKFLQFEPNTADVAQVGEMIYQTLQEAIDHAENKTIKLLKNIALDEAIDTKGKSFILDLNGKIIDGEEGTAIMQNGGTLTIQDNVGGGRIITAGSDTITVNN